MPPTTRTITFSLPRDMADRVEEMVKQEGRSRSALLREALSRYMEENEWQQLLRYGEQRTSEQQISSEDVSRLVEEYRADIGSSRA